MDEPVDTQNNGKVELNEPSPEQSIELLRLQLQDALLLLGQKEMQIQRQILMIKQLQEKVAEK